MTRVLFLADQFSDVARSRADGHPGGAELTDEAAIDACPWSLEKLTFRELARDRTVLVRYDVIVVGNSETAEPDDLLAVASTERHVTFEHDLRICRWRGNFTSGREPAHRTFQRCWCPHLPQRELFARALGTIFLTRLQERYYRRNPFFHCDKSQVLGASLFGARTLETVASVPAGGERSGTSVFASPHPVKGYREALAYCRRNGLVSKEIAGLKPMDVLRHFSRTERFVYLPVGPEWAGRMVVEARLLGCEIVANDLVGVTGEPVWKGSRQEALSFLGDGPKRFWRIVEDFLGQPREAHAPVIELRDRAAEAVVSLLKAPSSCFWPRGPRPLRRSPISSHPPW